MIQAELFAHHFNDHSLVALAIELGIENLLPGTEVELPIRDRHDDFVMDDERFEMRVSVVFAGLMMLVVLTKWSQRLQPLVDVFDQPALVVIDIHARSYMHGRDKNHAIFNPGLFQSALHLRRQMYVGSLRFRMHREVFGVEFHTPHLPRRGPRGKVANAL